MARSKPGAFDCCGGGGGGPFEPQAGGGSGAPQAGGAIRGSGSGRRGGGGGPTAPQAAPGARAGAGGALGPEKLAPENRDARARAEYVAMAAGLERDLARELPPRIHAELARARDAYNELVGMVDTPPNRRGGAPAPAPAPAAANFTAASLSNILAAVQQGGPPGEI